MMNYQFEDRSLIYIGDPLCSWCWGMAKELTTLKDKYSFPFHVVVGGLRPGTTAPMTDHDRGSIRHHWEEVIKRSGQPINFTLLDDKVPFIYNTEVPCRAVVTVRAIDPDKTLSFFKLVQQGFYEANGDTNQLNFYHPLTQKLGVDFEEFEKRFYSEEIRKETNDDFMWCRQIGANSFPTIILNHDSQFYAIAIGYATYVNLKSRIEDILKKKI